MSADDKFASRKFVLASFAFVAGVVLLACKVISADQWVMYAPWVLALYFGANVADTFADRT